MRGTIKSKTIENRNVFIYLPPCYESNNKKYPVIYIHDGDEMIKYKKDFFEKIEKKNLEFIGVFITHKDRFKDLTPWYSEPLPNHKEEFMGNGDEYINFICNELKPYVDKNYNTKKEAKNTYIMGSSLGGLISMYALFTKKDIFGNCISVSGSFWYKDMLSFMAKKELDLSDNRVFISVGAKEGKNNEFNGMMKESTLKAYEILKLKGIKESIHIHVNECSKHSINCFLPMFIEGIEWMLK